MATFQNVDTGRVSNPLDVECFTSAARTATVNGATKCVGDLAVIRAVLSITAFSGTSPTVAITMQTSTDGTTWVSLPAVGSEMGTTAGAVTTVRRVYAGADRFIRAVATIGGTTPSLTFSVLAEAM